MANDTPRAPRAPTHNPRALFVVRFVHTLVWAVMALAIAALPVLALARVYDWAQGIVALVMAEVAVLLINGWRCPLTNIAERYTDDRRPNFDIFLPEWLAYWNKEIFGTLFVAGLLTLAASRWGWLG